MGRRVQLWIDRGREAQSFWISMGIGLGLWGFCILLLGLLGLLRMTALLAVAGLFWIWTWLQSSGSKNHENLDLLTLQPDRVERLFSLGAAAVSGVFIGIGLASSLAPELSFDALNVHLPYARDAAAAHRLAFAQNNWSSVMPALPIMTYITAFVCSGVTLAKLFNLSCYLATGGAIHWFCARMWGRTHAWGAAVLFFSSPVAIYEATTALIDLPFAMYSAIAVLALLEWTTSDRRSFLWLSAIALGFAAGCKYHAAFWFMPVLLILLWHLLRVRKLGAKSALKLVATYALIVCALAAPWLLRAWWHTGNPVFPLANGWFQSPYFPPSMHSAAVAMYANEGVGKSLSAMILLPWTATFDPGPFRGSAGVLFLPGVLLALARARHGCVRYGVLLTVFYFYTWAFTAQEIRYLLPLVPLLAYLTAIGFLGGPHPHRTAVSSDRRPVPRLAQGAGMLCMLGGSLMCLPQVYPLWAKDWTYWHAYQSPVPYLLGKQSAQEYVSRDVPSIHVYDFINENLAASDRILLLNDASQFYSSVPTLYSFTVEGERILAQKTEAGLLAKLNESRITHVLLNYNGIAPLPGVTPRQGVYFFLDPGFQERHLEQLFTRNNVTLYRVRH